MAGIALQSQLSTGHDCWPPTNSISNFTTRTTINGLAIQLIGTRYNPHSCNNTTHDNIVVIEGSSNTFFEGIAVARIGDALSCGDTIGQSSFNSFVG